MARSANYTALLDACVLYPAPVRDLLLSLSISDLFHARWSAEIEREWVSNLLQNRSDLTTTQLEETCSLMKQAVPDCLIENYEKFIPAIHLPDENDRHVLAAAVKGGVDAIVTFNLKDFPKSVLDEYDIEAIHPDDFIMNQLELSQPAALAAVKAMRARLRNPPIRTEDFISTIERCQLVQCGGFLRRWQDLI
jgi:predicted nucleic acid-binding protein